VRVGQREPSAWAGGVRVRLGGTGARLGGAGVYASGPNASPGGVSTSLVGVGVYPGGPSASLIGVRVHPSGLSTSLVGVSVYPGGVSASLVRVLVRFEMTHPMPSERRQAPAHDRPDESGGVGEAKTSDRDTVVERPDARGAGERPASASVPSDAARGNDEAGGGAQDTPADHRQGLRYARAAQRRAGDSGGAGRGRQRGGRAARRVADGGGVPALRSLVLRQISLPCPYVNQGERDCAI
jgi:hypothetical protein